MTGVAAPGATTVLPAMPLTTWNSGHGALPLQLGPPGPSPAADANVAEVMVTGLVHVL